MQFCSGDTARKDKAVETRRNIYEEDETHNRYTAGNSPFYCRILLAKGILHITQEEDSLSCLNRNINPFKAATYMIQIYLTSSVSICPAISFPFVRGTLQVASTSISSVIRRLIVCAVLLVTCDVCCLTVMSVNIGN